MIRFILVSLSLSFATAFALSDQSDQLYQSQEEISQNDEAACAQSESLNFGLPPCCTSTSDRYLAVSCSLTGGHPGCEKKYGYDRCVCYK